VEVKNLVLGQNTLSAGVELEGLEESLVDSINTLLLAGSSQTRATPRDRKPRVANSATVFL
jgi:hypothetical protein